MNQSSLRIRHIRDGKLTDTDPNQLTDEELSQLFLAIGPDKTIATLCSITGISPEKTSEILSNSKLMAEARAKAEETELNPSNFKEDSGPGPNYLKRIAITVDSMLPDATMFVVVTARESEGIHVLGNIPPVKRAHLLCVANQLMQDQYGEEKEE